MSTTTTEQPTEVLSCNNPVSVTLGATTYPNIVVFAWKNQAVGGGDAEVPRTVQGSYTPVSTTSYPKETILTLTVDSKNIMQNISAVGYWNWNGANASFILKLKDRDATTGQTRDITFPNVTRIQTVEIKYADKDKPVTELKMVTWGSVAYSAWT